MIHKRSNGQGTRCRADSAGSGSGGPRLSRLRLSSRFACAVFFARSPALQAPPRRSASRLRTSARAPPAPRCRLSSAAPATARATRLARAPLAPPSRARRCRCEAPQPSRLCRYERATQDRHRGLIARCLLCGASDALVALLQAAPPAPPACAAPRRGVQQLPRPALRRSFAAALSRPPPRQPLLLSPLAPRARRVPRAAPLAAAVAPPRRCVPPARAGRTRAP
jgi:hypothetical protein